jgi:5-methylcytosine-specific restriction protein B
MNTADKSIRLLDAAFRRRFGFIELMPEPDLLAGSPVDRVALDDLLIELNRRIASRFGREKQIGHSFFMVGTKPLSDIDLLAQRFRLEVLPILQDYFFDDWAGLAEVLGTNIVDVDNYRIKPELIEDPIALQEALSLIAGSNSEADES